MIEPKNPTFFKEKRKWQIALRRYVLEQKPSPFYAPFFGLPITLFRKWIEEQFEGGISWDHFSDKWQFEHILPINYFDFNNQQDLRLCWSFINIRVEKLNTRLEEIHTIDTLSAKRYFTQIFKSTGFPLCQEMIQKIEAIETKQLERPDKLEGFIQTNQETLRQLEQFSHTDFERVNLGMSIDEVITENQMFLKYGK